MVAAAALLAILDAVIISANPTGTRVAFALVVSLVVGLAIVSIWRGNSKLEKASAEQDKGTPGASKPPAGRGKKGHQIQ
jgi:hypothetical protein